MFQVPGLASRLLWLMWLKEDRCVNLNVLCGKNVNHNEYKGGTEVDNGSPIPL